jgi:hypothetical protein
MNLLYTWKIEKPPKKNKFSFFITYFINNKVHNTHFTLLMHTYMFSSLPACRLKGEVIEELNNKTQK